MGAPLGGDLPGGASGLIMPAAARAPAIFAPPHTLDRELDEELHYHLERQIDEYPGGTGAGRRARRGAAVDGRPAAAQGGVPGHARTDPARQPVAGRRLRRTAAAGAIGFTCTATLMLALGLCASVSIFAFVDASLVKPLPYEQPSRLVGVFEKVTLFPRSNLCTRTISIGSGRTRSSPRSTSTTGRCSCCAGRRRASRPAPRG